MSKINQTQRERSNYRENGYGGRINSIQDLPTSSMRELRGESKRRSQGSELSGLELEE